MSHDRPGRRRTRRLRTLIGANLVGVALLAPIGGWDIVQLYSGIGLPTRVEEPMLIVAHRGDLARFPENTLQAIAAATELDVDGIEFDVQASRDGTWWLLHDRTLDRTTDGSGPISSQPDTALARLRVDGGLGFDSARHSGIRLSRLSDALALLGGFDGLVIVDAQHVEHGDLSGIAEQLSGHRGAVICATPADAAEVKTADPAVMTLLRPEYGPADGKVDIWLMEALFEADIGAVERSALPVATFVDEWQFGWDEAALIRRAWRSGVWAFLSKDPAAALAEVEHLSTSHP